MMKTNSQNYKIKNHLVRLGSITGLEAWDSYRVRCLPRRIADLRELGMPILSERKRDLQGQRYVRYVLDEPQEAAQLNLL